MARRRNDNASGTGLTYVEGVEDVMALLQELVVKAPERYESILTDYGDKIGNSAKSRIKDKTGNLRSSCNTKRTFTANTKKVSVIFGGTKAPHAHLVEFGHRMVTHSGQVVGDVKPHRFLRPAFEEHLPNLTRELESALDSLT